MQTQHFECLLQLSIKHSIESLGKSLREGTSRLGWLVSGLPALTNKGGAKQNVGNAFSQPLTCQKEGKCFLTFVHLAFTLIVEFSTLAYTADTFTCTADSFSFQRGLKMRKLSESSAPVVPD